MANGNPGFIKRCPKCGASNPEYENLCQQCGFFIAMEAAQPAPVAAPEPQAATKPSDIQPLKLELSLSGSGLQFAIKSGDVLGQAHPQSDASIQLPEGLPDVAYVHRRHCRFWQSGTQWQLEAIDQSQVPGSSDFTNPTWINGVPVQPGERRSLGHGDDVRLSAITLLVSLQPDS
jgi:hypothetical protein